MKQNIYKVEYNNTPNWVKEERKRKEKKKGKWK